MTEGLRTTRAVAWLRIGLVLAIVVGATVLFATSGIADRVTVGQVRGLRTSAGVWAPALYVLVYVIGTVLAFPGLVITLVGGMLFGTFAGAVLVTIGAWIGAMLAFLVARAVGRSAVERLVAGGRLERFDRVVGRTGVSSVLFTRLVPVVPFNVVNYLWGLSSVSFRDYALATFVGMIPAELVYTNIGGAIGRTLEGRDDVALSALDVRAFLNGDVALALALLGVMALVPTVLRFVRRDRGVADPPT